eukprot:TRINITY_DN7795_c0_g2_i1.p1 TRINITY_DN7795_c0_g2~~TRINITY_DN7795_c0_g2_i1.p1  ORF type:complete len:981 (+),score=279.86 TRINITY_DN7795_c0_g2_i1:265-2943(+)
MVISPRSLTSAEEPESPASPAAMSDVDDAIGAAAKARVGELVAAVVGNNYDGVRRWAQQHQRVDTVDAQGWTALHWAAANNSSAQILDFLVGRMKADVNALTENQWTPLHFAVYNDNTAVTEVLLRLGAQTSVRDDQGYTPEDVAKECGNLDMQGYLHDHSLKVRRAAFKTGVGKQCASIREHKAADQKQKALQMSLTQGMAEEKKRKDREMNRRRIERERVRQQERRRQLAIVCGRESIREMQEREMLQRAWLVEWFDVLIDQEAEMECCGREDLEELVVRRGRRRSRRESARRRTRRFSKITVRTASSGGRGAALDSGSRTPSPKGGRLKRRRTAKDDEARVRERLEREQDRERELEQERVRQQELNEARAREAEAELRRREALLDWLETAEMVHAGDYEKAADGSGWVWTCCGLREERGDGCIPADDRMKPLWHPGEYKYHVDDCRCGVIAAAGTSAAPKSQFIPPALPSPRVRWRESDPPPPPPSQLGAPTPQKGWSRSLMFTQDMGDLVDAKPQAAADDTSPQAVGSPVSAVRGAASQRTAKGKDFCAPGGFCWSCCGATEQVAQGCTLQKALRLAVPQFLQPTWAAPPPWAPGLKLSPQLQPVTAEFAAAARPTTYRTYTLVADCCFDRGDCAAFEFQIEACGPASRGEYIIVGLMADAGRAGAAATSQSCFEYLGGGNSLGWWSESSLIVGMGRREASLKGVSGHRLKYSAGDTIAVMVDCVNKEVVFFHGRQVAAVVKLPTVLGRQAVRPAVTLHPGARVSFRPCIKTAATLALRSTAREHERAVVQWIERRYREEKEAREGTLRRGVSGVLRRLSATSGDVGLFGSHLSRKDSSRSQTHTAGNTPATASQPLPEPPGLPDILTPSTAVREASPKPGSSSVGGW